MLSPFFGLLLGLLALVISWITHAGVFASVSYAIFFLVIVAVVTRLFGARGLEVERFVGRDRIYLGEQALIQVKLKNRSWLPRFWVLAQDATIAGLPMTGVRGGFASLAPGGELAFSYSLRGTRRGYFPLGPMRVRVGDPFGLTEARTEQEAAFLTVYPKIVSVRAAELPSRRPVGDVRARYRLLEDPTRTLGVREYRRGDSLKQIHWKATAHTGQLQSRLHEVASQMEVMLALDLDQAAYPHELWLTEELMELAITVAASLGCHILEQGQRVGLLTNGLDSAAPSERRLLLPPSSEQEQKVQLLSLLARLRLQPASRDHSNPLAEVLAREQENLPWSGLVTVISPSVSESLTHALLSVRAAGFAVALLLINQTRPRGLTSLSATGIPVRVISQEAEIDRIGF